jgi:hypothetical protein
MRRRCVEGLPLLTNDTLLPRLPGLARIRRELPVDARDRLEAALVLFQRLGARNDVEGSTRLLGTLG